MTEPCTRQTIVGDVIGSACPDCGHTNVVHPGAHNPAIESCVLCRLEHVWPDRNSKSKGTLK